MRQPTWSRKVVGAGGLLPLVAAALVVSSLAGCALNQVRRPEEALPLEVHHRLTEVQVVARSEGPILVTRLTQLPDWDGLAPEGLHAALRDGVAGEVRALGLRAAATDTLAVAPEAAPAPRLAPAPRPADAEWSGDAPPVPPVTPSPRAVARPPAPPPGVAWVEVQLVRADLEWAAGGDAPAMLTARFHAQVTAGHPGTPAVAARTFTLRDPELRTGAAWAADGGAAVTAGLERLVARAARRMASGLLATASDATRGPTGEGCGPAPKAREPSGTGPRHDPDGQAWARWEDWAPGLPKGASAEIGYDLRAWRLEARGEAVPILEVDDLSQTAARLSPPGGPAATYAWSVRGVARLADGRRVRSRWSQPRIGLDQCAPEPDPWLAHRAEVDGPRARVAAAPEGGPDVTVDYRPVTWEVRREGLGPDLNAGTGAAQGLVHGLGGGLKASLACGPFFPICAIFMVPGGAAVGLTAGLVVGGVSSVVRATSRTESAALPPEPLRGALVAALEREAHRPALAASLRAAAEAGLGDRAPDFGLDALELTLIGQPGEDHLAELQLTAAGTLRRADAPPVRRRVDVTMPATAGAVDLAGDGAAAIALAVRTQGPEAGRRLAVALLTPDPQPEPAPALAAEPQASDDGSRYAGPPAD